jgi:hypothetical protein
VAQAEGGPDNSGLERGDNFIRKLCIVSVLFPQIK